MMGVLGRARSQPAGPVTEPFSTFSDQQHSRRDPVLRCVKGAVRRHPPHHASASFMTARPAVGSMRSVPASFRPGVF